MNIRERDREALRVRHENWKQHVCFGGGLGQCGKRNEKHGHWFFANCQKQFLSLLVLDL